MNTDSGRDPIPSHSNEWEKLKLRNVLKNNNLTYTTIFTMFILILIYGFFILKAPWWAIYPAALVAFIMTIYTLDGAQAIRRLFRVERPEHSISYIENDKIDMN